MDCSTESPSHYWKWRTGTKGAGAAVRNDVLPDARRCLQCHVCPHLAGSAHDEHHLGVAVQEEVGVLVGGGGDVVEVVGVTVDAGVQVDAVELEFIIACTSAGARFIGSPAVQADIPDWEARQLGKTDGGDTTALG